MLQSDSATAVGHIPSGLFIVAVEEPSSKVIDGYLASWVQQVSFKPMMVSLAIKPGRPAYDLIKAGHEFIINVVGDHEKAFLKHFWKGYDPANNPFDVLKHDHAVLLDAKSAIRCKFVSSQKPGDHEVIFAEVLASYVMNSESKPMVHVRKSGADY
jgi:flavin reductase (DIM6/NTAB) family NADH-FMN oxidoreductase RutF